LGLYCYKRPVLVVKVIIKVLDVMEWERIFSNAC
jgi:hypothetical protein